MPNEIIEVFRTNIISENISEKIKVDIKSIFPNMEVNFDLEDCDHILRIVGESYAEIKQVSNLVVNQGFICDPLPD